jgi:hypothetical protein
MYLQKGLGIKVKRIFFGILRSLTKSSVADPGYLSRIPDPTFFHPGSQIPDPNCLHPGSESKNLSILTPKKPKKWFLSSRKYDTGCSSLIPDPDADFLPIPDPGSRGQKSTGSRILRIRNTDPKRAGSESGSVSQNYGSGSPGLHPTRQTVPVLTAEFTALQRWQRLFPTTTFSSNFLKTRPVWVGWGYRYVMLLCVPLPPPPQPPQRYLFPPPPHPRPYSPSLQNNLEIYLQRHRKYIINASGI